MTDKIVIEYLKARRNGQKGLKSPHISFTAAKLDDLPIEIFDYEIRAKSPLNGLLCRVRKSGVKSLEVFRKPSGSYKPVRVKLGHVGDAPLTGTSEYSFKSRLQKVLHELSNGINPNEVKKSEAVKKAAEQLTLTEAATWYLKDSKLKKSTAQSYRSIINNHFNAELENQLAEILNKTLLIRLHKHIETKSGPVAANNAMRVLRAISNYARIEMEDHNGYSPIPLWPIKGKQQNKRFWNTETRRSGWIRPENLKKWWEATEALPIEYDGNGELARDYLQFVLLSGLRRREATSLSWNDIDFAAKSFKIFDTKNNQTLELPCSDYMIKILNRRKGKSESGPFELKEPKKFVAWVRRKADVNFTVHDLRRTFITYAESLDFGAYTIKALVNHSPGNSRDVTEGYLQLSVERLRKPMQSITDYVISQTNRSNVTSMRSRSV